MVVLRLMVGLQKAHALQLIPMLMQAGNTYLMVLLTKVLISSQEQVSAHQPYAMEQLVLTVIMMIMLVSKVISEADHVQLLLSISWFLRKSILQIGMLKVFL